MRVETNPLEAAYAALLTQGLDGAGEALRILVRRGLCGVKLIVSDNPVGLKAARRAVLPSVPWQRCPFHLQQNTQA